MNASGNKKTPLERQLDGVMNRNTNQQESERSMETVQDTPDTTTPQNGARCSRGYEWCDGGLCAPLPGMLAAPVHRNSIRTFADSISVEVCYDEGEPERGMYFYVSADGELDHLSGSQLLTEAKDLDEAVRTQRALFNRLSTIFPTTQEVPC